MHIKNAKFRGIVHPQWTAAILTNMSHPSLFPQKKVWMKMISFIRSFCKYRRFMSSTSMRQEFEEYLHLEMQSKESKSRLSLVSAAGRAHISSCRALAPCHSCLGSGKRPRSWVRSHAQACPRRMEAQELLLGAREGGE